MPMLALSLSFSPALHLPLGYPSNTTPPPQRRALSSSLVFAFLAARGKGKGKLCVVSARSGHALSKNRCNSNPANMDARTGEDMLGVVDVGVPARKSCLFPPLHTLRGSQQQMRNNMLSLRTSLRQ